MGMNRNGCLIYGKDGDGCLEGFDTDCYKSLWFCYSGRNLIQFLPVFLSLGLQGVMQSFHGA